MKRLGATVLIVVLVVIIGFGAYFYFSNSGEEFSSSAPKEKVGETSVQWATYENQYFPFTFQYPENAEVSIERGQPVVKYLGPGNIANSEISDGFTFYIHTEDLAGKTVKQFAQSEYQNAAVDGLAVSIQKPERVTLGGKTGYQYAIRNVAGSKSTFFVFSPDSKSVFFIAYSIWGAKEPEYTRVVDRMIESATLE